MKDSRWYALLMMLSIVISLEYDSGWQSIAWSVLAVIFMVASLVSVWTESKEPR